MVSTLMLMLGFSPLPTTTTAVHTCLGRRFYRKRGSTFSSLVVWRRDARTWSTALPAPRGLVSGSQPDRPSVVMLHVTPLGGGMKSTSVMARGPCCPPSVSLPRVQWMSVLLRCSLYSVPSAWLFSRKFSISSQLEGLKCLFHFLFRFFVRI